MQYSCCAGYIRQLAVKGLIYNYNAKPWRAELTGTVVFVVVDKFGNRCKRMFLSKIVKTFCVLSYVVMLHYAHLSTARTATS